MNAISRRLDPSPEVFIPPKPNTLSAVLALLRGAFRGDGDLLSLLPTAAYKTEIGRLGYSRRSILIVNQLGTQTSRKFVANLSHTAKGTCINWAARHIKQQT